MQLLCMQNKGSRLVQLRHFVALVAEWHYSYCHKDSRARRSHSGTQRLFSNSDPANSIFPLGSALNGYAQKKQCCRR